MTFEKINFDETNRVCFFKKHCLILIMILRISWHDTFNLLSLNTRSVNIYMKPNASRLYEICLACQLEKEHLPKFTQFLLVKIIFLFCYGLSFIF